jgi:hypothetical protein
MSYIDKVFDFIAPFSSEKTKWLVIYFVTALDCLSPVLEALYFTAWAEVNPLDNIGFGKALLAHYSSLFKCVPMDQIFNLVFPTNNQLVCLPLYNGDSFSFGIGFIGKLVNLTGFNLSMIVEESRVIVTFLPDTKNRRPLLWHEHFLDNYIASEVNPAQ